MDWVHLFFDHNCSSCLQVARPHQGFFNSNGQHYLTGLVVKKNQIFKATLLQSRIIDELKGVFLQHLQGKPWNIYRLQKNPCRYCRFLLRILQKNPLNHPVNPCKHLQCKDLDLANVYAVLYWVQKVLRCSDFLSPMNWHYITHTYSEYPWLQ